MILSRREIQEEQYRRAMLRLAILDELHALQRSVVVSPARFKAVRAGRRGGKTNLDARYLAIETEKSGPGDWCLYSAVTRTVAKDLIWDELDGVNKRHNLGWNLRAHEGLVVAPRGGKIRILGFDRMPEVEKACGYRVRLFIADEPHSYAKRLQYLVDEKLTPALSDLAGTFLMNGTPGVGRFGYWFKASMGKLPEYATWHWTMRENTKFPRDPVVAMAEILALKKWTVETPAFRREWLAEWCDDPEKTVYAYVEDRNAIDPIEVDKDGLFTMGVDFGVKNATSWTVWYSPRNTQKAFCIHSSKQAGLLVDAVTDITKKLVDQYKPKLVGDAGGLGAPYVKAWNARYGNQAGMHMKPADKLGKLAHIRTLNDSLRTGAAQVVERDAAVLIDEWSNLTWEDDRKEKEDPQCENDAADSALYAFVDHTSFWHTVPPPPPTKDEAEKLAQQERIRKVQEARRAAQAEEENW